MKLPLLADFFARAMGEQQSRQNFLHEKIDSIGFKDKLDPSASLERLIESIDNEMKTFADSVAIHQREDAANALLSLVMMSMIASMQEQYEETEQPKKFPAPGMY